MISSFTLSKDVFAQKADAIAILANKAYKVEYYSFESVEIGCALRDYQDGRGRQFITVATLRNPSTLQYDLHVDVAGPPEEALNLLHRTLSMMNEQNSSVSRYVN